MGLQSIPISIHLMFLLIKKPLPDLGHHFHFNTSHVSINPLRKLVKAVRIFISIHLMFLLIAAAGSL
mgnify:FL=1